MTVQTDIRAVWTREMVRERIEEAMWTLARLRMTSRDRPAGYRCGMPEVVRTFSESYGYDGDPGVKIGAVVIIPRDKDREPRPSSPSPTEIDQAEEALTWLLRFDRRRRIAIAARCQYSRISWRAIGKRIRRSESTCKRWVSQGLKEIAEELNRTRPNQPISARVGALTVFGAVSMARRRGVAQKAGK